MYLNTQRDSTTKSHISCHVDVRFRWMHFFFCKNDERHRPNPNPNPAAASERTKRQGPTLLTTRQHGIRARPWRAFGMTWQKCADHLENRTRSTINTWYNFWCCWYLVCFVGPRNVVKCAASHANQACETWLFFSNFSIYTFGLLCFFPVKYLVQPTT